MTQLVKHLTLDSGLNLWFWVQALYWAPSWVWTLLKRKKKKKAKKAGMIQWLGVSNLMYIKAKIVISNKAEVTQICRDGERLLFCGLDSVHIFLVRHDDNVVLIWCWSDWWVPGQVLCVWGDFVPPRLYHTCHQHTWVSKSWYTWTKQGSRWHSMKYYAAMKREKWLRAWVCFFF